jgi:hypothetical protein
VRVALERSIRQPAEEVRLLITARNEAYIKAIYRKAVGGDLGAIDRCLKIDRQTAALHGVSEVKVKVGGDADALPIGVVATLDAKLRNEVYARLNTDELRLLRDLRDRLAGPAGGGSDGEAAATVDLHGT